MKKTTQNVETWGMEHGVYIPTKIYASDDDLSSDGKLILCSKKRKYKDDVEYVNLKWMRQILEECLGDNQETLNLIINKIYDQ